MPMGRWGAETVERGMGERVGKEEWGKQTLVMGEKRGNGKGVVTREGGEGGSLRGDAAAR